MSNSKRVIKIPLHISLLLSCKCIIYLAEKAPEEELAPPLPEQTTVVVPDQTTLIPNEAEAFALEPIDVTSIGKSRNRCYKYR